MQTAKCRAVVEDLVLLLNNPEPDRDRLERAIAHVESCPYCTSRIGYLLKALEASPREDVLTCQECQALLPDYLWATASGEGEGSSWRHVATHLSACPSCTAIYQALAELAALADGEQGAEPPAYPIPDLSFLRADKALPTRRPEFRWWMDELGHLIVRFSDELLQGMQQQGIRAAAAGLKGTPQQELLESASVQATDDLAVTITAEEEPGDPDRCALLVFVDVPSRGGWPNLAGSQVILRRQEQELDRRWTDAFGQAVFERVATRSLEQLALDITPIGAEER